MGIQTIGVSRDPVVATAAEMTSSDRPIPAPAARAAS
jgi:hypothetical protein